MRTSFELKLVAESLEGATTLAVSKIAAFLKINTEDVLDQVTLEMKIAYPKAETFVEVEDLQNANMYIVTAYGSVKQGIVKPFGII